MNASNIHGNGNCFQDYNETGQVMWQSMPTME